MLGGGQGGWVNMRQDLYRGGHCLFPVLNYQYSVYYCNNFNKDPQS